MNSYIVTHRVGKKVVKQVVDRKLDATDYAYSIVARTKGSSATVKRTNGVMTWGVRRRVSAVTFFWEGQNIGSRSSIKRKPKAAPGYTHRDSSGMGWRFVGSRPVSALADQVMRDCGMELR